MASTPRPHEAADTDAPITPTPVLLEAIARKLCVTTTYNKTTVLFAPYILYTRHDDLFVDAVTLERDGKKPRELKLGTFKLAGLGQVALTRRIFSPEPAFDPGTEKYTGTTLFAVETVPARTGTNVR